MKLSRSFKNVPTDVLLKRRIKRILLVAAEDETKEEIKERSGKIEEEIKEENQGRD